jgi:hypothetical protein
MMGWEKRAAYHPTFIPQRMQALHSGCSNRSARRNGSLPAGNAGAADVES